MRDFVDFVAFWLLVVGGLVAVGSILVSTPDEPIKLEKRVTC